MLSDPEHITNADGRASFVRRHPSGRVGLEVRDDRGYGGGFAWWVWDDTGKQIASGALSSQHRASACAHGIARAMGWIQPWGRE